MRSQCSLNQNQRSVFCSFVACKKGEKWHELAGFGLALNYAICGRTVNLDQLKKAALEPLSKIMKSCLFVTCGCKY